MAVKTALRRGGVGLAASAMLLSACSFMDDDPQDEAGEESATTDEVVRERDDKLDIALISDESGPLEFLTQPQSAAITLAEQDINAAGGVNGQDVTFATGDEAGDRAVVREVAAQFVLDEIDAIIGPSSSGMGQEIIQMLHDNQIVQCGASATSPTFSAQSNNTYYFRTVPPDEAVAPVIAQHMVETEGHSNIAIVFRNDDYGRALSELVGNGLTDLGATVVDRIGYNPEDEDLGYVVDEIMAAEAAGADAISVISFGEILPVLAQAIDSGIPPERFYGSDGMFGRYVADAIEGILDPEGEEEGFAAAGMTVFGAAGDAEFNERLTEVLPAEERTNTAYGGQTYDCVVVIALAAIAADSVDPAVFYEVVPDQTKDGTKCESFADCKELLEAGEDIDYDGVAGALEIVHPDPTVGGYAIAEFAEDGTLSQIDAVEVDLTDLG